jgi:hypothetical protein
MAFFFDAQVGDGALRPMSRMATAMLSCFAAGTVGALSKR